MDNIDITFKKLTKNEFSEIYKELKTNISFGNIDNIFCIEYENKIIGLISFNEFIYNTLSIHIALIKNYTNKGIGTIIWNKISEYFGPLYEKYEYFIANTYIDNIQAINSLNKTTWKKTEKYNEIMEIEGGEYFLIYEKENPYYKTKKLLKI